MDAAAFFQVVVQEDPVGRPLKIIILTGFERPQKCEQAAQAQTQRDGNEEQQGRHQPSPSTGAFPARAVRRKAFRVTMTEEADMAMAAIRGVTSPDTATGTAMRL